MPGSKNGNIFAIIEKGGYKHKIRLGAAKDLPNRNINKEEADVLFDIADRIINRGLKPTDMYVAKGFKNLSATNILSLLIDRQNEDFIFAAPDKKGNFKRNKDDEIVQNWKVITISDGDTRHVFRAEDFKDVKRANEFKALVKKVLRRQVHAAAFRTRSI